MRVRKDCVDISRDYSVKSGNLAIDYVMKMYVPRTVEILVIQT